MSDRHLRDSTSRLRHYYSNLPRRERSKERRSGLSQPRKASSNETMAAVGNAGQPGTGTPASPGGTQDVPTGEPGGEPGGQPGAGVHTTPPRPAAQDMAEYIGRLKALEEKFKQCDEARASRASSRASSQPRKSTSKPPTPRPYTPERSSRRPERRSSSHYSSRSKHRRGYSPTSHCSSSRRRRSRTRSRHRHNYRSRSRRRSTTRSPRRTSARRRSRSRSRSRSSRRSRSGLRSPRRDTSPRSLRKDADAAHDTALALEAQYPSMGRPSGKHLPKSKATLEPYRHLPPDIKKRARERRSRRDLSLPEHVCGLLLMAVRVMDPNSEAYAIIQHAAQVAQDATTMRWPTVRGWSQACLAHIETDPADWYSSALFKEERFRLSWCKGKSQPDTMIPCPAFNMATCTERGQHSGEGRTWLHLCAVCYYGMNDTLNSHTSQGCRRKPGLKLVTDDNRNDNRRRYNNQQNNNRRDDKPDRPKPKN